MTATDSSNSPRARGAFATPTCLLALALLTGCIGDLPDRVTGEPLTPDASSPSDEDAGSSQDADVREDASSTTGDDSGGGADSDVPPADSGNDSGPGMPVIVASGGNHQLALSIDDGRTWCVSHDDDSMTDHDNPHLLRNVTYANGYFVSGSWRALFRSRNGYEWEDVTNGEGTIHGEWIAQVQYGNGYWVATGGYGTAMRSADMQTWENMSEELPGEEASRSLAFGDGVFVTSRDDVGWWQSTDGTSWTQRNEAGGRRVYFDGSEFRDHPGYDCAPDGETCLRNDGAGIERSDDGGSSWTMVAELPNATERFAFGEAPAEDLADGADVPADVRECLGL